MDIEKVLRNSCGHEAWYKIKAVDGGIDIESDVNGLCENCAHEDTQFKAQIAEIFQKMFEN